MNFAQRLRELRTERGESQSDLGRLIKVSRQTVGNYESGVRFPNDDRVIIELSEHFNVTADYLFGLSDYRHGLHDRMDDDLKSMNKKEIIRSIQSVLEQLEYEDIVKINQMLYILYGSKC